MRITVSSPGLDLKEEDINRIEKDLEKIDRRLHEYKEVDAQVRVSGNQSATTYNVTLEVHYSRNHLLTKTQDSDIGRAVREAREEILRQINDRSRRGHSSFTKGR